MRTSIFYEFLNKMLEYENEISPTTVCLDFLQILEANDYKIPNELIKHLILEDREMAIEFLKNNKILRKYNMKKKVKRGHIN